MADPQGTRTIGILTGGGDAPGLNAVIRAVVKCAANRGYRCLGLEDSFDGLLEVDRHRVLGPREVTGILRLGGTILGTKNRGNPLDGTVETTDGPRPYAERVVEIFHRLGLHALVAIGGDGTLTIAHEFVQRGLPVVGVPKTIDNDILQTVTTFGFESAVEFASEAIDRLHVTAEAHHRIMVVEVMGRNAGWIALYAGLAGGADVILIPEIPYDLDKVADRLREREKYGARFSIVVVAEGARPRGGARTIAEAASAEHVERLGGVGAVVARTLEKLTGRESRAVVLGHLQRGGSPSSDDRVLATRFGAKAVELVHEGFFGLMVASRPPDIVSVPLAEVVGRQRLVPADSDVVKTARAIGVSLGD